MPDDEPTGGEAPAVNEDLPRGEEAEEELTAPVSRPVQMQEPIV